MNIRTALCALLLAAPALGGESSASKAVGLPNHLGLCGFQDMVDARVPSLLSVRVGLRYDLQVSRQEFTDSVGAVRDLERHDVVAYGGVSALGLLDAAIRVPFVYRRDDTDLNGVADQFRARYDEGWADLDFAGKVAINLGPIDLSPFVFGRAPSGEPDVEDLARFEYGAAATFAPIDYFAVHGNLAGVQVERGGQAFRYRVGVSIVPFATDALVIRAYGYGDGIEYEGSADSDFDLDLGVQTIIMSIFTLEVGTTVRVEDAEFIDEELEEGLNAGGIVTRHIRDEGTWGLSIVAGILLTF